MAPQTRLAKACSDGPEERLENTALRIRMKKAYEKAQQGRSI
jgi:hypothetical protein